MLFGGVMLLAMQSADSQPMGAEGADIGDRPSLSLAPARLEPDGYYQAEYAARRRCDPGRCGRPVTSPNPITYPFCRNRPPSASG